METALWQQVLSLALGLGLAAACGFRVFVPCLALGLAARADWVSLGPGFAWLEGTPALITLAVATVLEVGAYFVPWLDHLLDGAASPAAVLAGIVVTAATFQGASPLLTWSLAAIAGGGLAGAVQGGSIVARGASTLLTGGLGNPLVASGELVGAIGLSLMALVVPLVALSVAGAIVLWLLVRLARRNPAPSPAAASTLGSGQSG